MIINDLAFSFNPITIHGNAMPIRRRRIISHQYSSECSHLKVSNGRQNGEAAKAQHKLGR